MSFVDDLNKRVTYAELQQAEEKYIERYTASILDAIKRSCTENKTKHFLEGYYASHPYGYSGNEILEDEEYAIRINKTVRLDTEKKELDLNKFRNKLNSGIKQLGFSQYQMEIKRYEIKVKRKFFGMPYYEHKQTDDYVVWISLRW